VNTNMKKTPKRPTRKAIARFLESYGADVLAHPASIRAWLAFERARLALFAEAGA